jgi:hypothetical protein
MKKSLTLLALAWGFAASAQMTPVGVWHTIDDETKQPKGEVRITDNNGVLSGVVGRALKEDPKAKTVCDLCTDDRKDQKAKKATMCGRAKAPFLTPTMARCTP